MDKKCVIMFLLVAVALTGGCQRDSTNTLATKKDPAAAAEKAETQPRPEPAGKKIIYVKTAEELVLAIGSDRTIKLRPGVYDLSSVAQKQTEFVRWAKVHDGYELIVRNVKGLKLIGPRKSPEILAKPRYANVLRFDNCKDITLENLVLGHTPEGYCEGGVLAINKSTGVTINKCDLFGCGIEGLTLSGVVGLKFNQSTIRDCTYGIMTVTKSRDLAFNGSRFIRNREFSGFSFSDSRNVRFKQCVIKDNRFDSLNATMFSVTSCSDIVVSGGSITGNVYKKLVAPVGGIELIDPKIESNTVLPEKGR
ncbi:MAG: hypothetical protein GY794_05950 [bacterium]|nr:hypothetical protein [bacterium]